MKRPRGPDIAAGAACLAVVTTMAIFVGHYGVNLPFYEEWVHAEILLKWKAGTLTFSDLWADYNQGRNVFHRLYPIALWTLGLRDLRWQMATSLLLATTTALLVARLAWRGLPGVEARVMAVVAFVLLLSPAQWQNFLWANQYLCFVPVLGLVLLITFVGLDLPARVCVPACIGVGLVATFTFTNGMLLWPLGAVALGSRAELRQRKWLALWGATAALVAGVYVHGLSKPQDHERFASLLQQPALLASHIVSQFGAPFWGQLPVLTAPAQSLIPVVFWLGLAVLICLCVAVVEVWRRSAGSAAMPWGLLVAYSGVSSVLLAGGRGPMALFTATLPRYITFILPGCVGIVGLLLVSGYRRLGCAVAGAFVVLSLARVPPTMERAANFNRLLRLGQVQVLFAATAPEATQSETILPRHEKLIPDSRQRMIDLSRLGLLKPGVIEDGNVAHLNWVETPVGSMRIVDGKVVGKVAAGAEFDGVVITVRLSRDSEIGVGVAGLREGPEGWTFEYALPAELATTPERVSAMAVKVSKRTAARIALEGAT